MAYNAYYINNGCYKNVFKTYVAFFDKRFKENRVKDIPQNILTNFGKILKDSIDVGKFFSGKFLTASSKEYAEIGKIMGDLMFMILLN